MRRLVDDIDPQGFIDLQEYVRYFHINDISLQKIYAIVFGEKISKNQRLSNWEATELSEQQQKYAAIDAWACLHLYRTLRSGNFHPDESPYIVDRSELNPAQNNQLTTPRAAENNSEPENEKKDEKPAKRKPASRARSKEAKAAKAAGTAEPKVKAEKKPKTAKSPKTAKAPKDNTASAETKKTRKPRKKTTQKTQE